MSSKATAMSGISTDSATACNKPKGESFQAEREKFLKDFEKPTQIYRYIRTRMLRSPIFLYRNLSYMRNRMSRSHHSRKGFKVDDMKKKAEEKQQLEEKSKLMISKKLSYNFLNLIILGFWDGQSWLPDTDAKLDLQIVRICLKKRKDTKVPITKAFAESCKIKVRSPSESVYKEEFSFPISKGKYPVMSVPKESFNLVNGHIVQSIRIVVRVSISASGLVNKSDALRHHENSNGAENSDLDKSSGGVTRNNGSRLSSGGSSMNSSKGSSTQSELSDEPKPKRQRSLPTKDRENFVYDTHSKQTNNRTNQLPPPPASDIIYVGMLTIYDKDNNVNIPAQGNTDIEFRLNKQDVKKPGIAVKRITQEGSWETSLEPSHSKIQEYLLRNGTTGCAAKIALALRGSNKKMEPMVDPPAPVTFSIKNSKETNEETECEENVRVVYQFVHGTNGRQMTESRNNLRCPWCSINCIELYSLLKHLKICHPRFNFSFAPIVNGARVDVSLNESYDGSYTGSAFDLVAQPPGEAFARNGPAKRTQVFSMIALKTPPLNRSLQEFFESDEKDAEQRRSYMTGHNRLYHHTTTCLPIHPREIDVDSEGEPDPEWLRVKTCMMIDEFTDVNEGEKEIMKMWNHHVMHDNYVGDCQIPLACKRFVERYGRDIIQKNLYRNFVLHLTNLYDFGLLPAQGFHATIQNLHSQMKENNLALVLKESWKASLCISSPSSSLAISNGSSSEDMEIDTSAHSKRILMNGSSTTTTINGSDNRNGHSS